MSNKNYILEIENLSVSAGGKVILSGLSCNFANGSLTVLMGPNGSGKSTLVGSIAGMPNLRTSKDSKIKFFGEDISYFPCEKRASKGIFLSFQNPPAIPGVSVRALLRAAHKNKDGIELSKNIKHFAKFFGVSDPLLSRSINDGFSGGERKKMELLQAAILAPKLLLLDEIDTGTDADTLSLITSFVKETVSKGASVILITHNARVLSKTSPERVLILKDGEIKADGGTELIRTVEKNGYGAF